MKTLFYLPQLIVNYPLTWPLRQFSRGSSRYKNYCHQGSLFIGCCRRCCELVDLSFSWCWNEWMNDNVAPCSTLCVFVSAVSKCKQVGFKLKLIRNMSRHFPSLCANIFIFFLAQIAHLTTSLLLLLRWLVFCFGACFCPSSLAFSSTVSLPASQPASQSVSQSTVGVQ